MSDHSIPTPPPAPGTPPSAPFHPGAAAAPKVNAPPVANPYPTPSAPAPIAHPEYPPGTAVVPTGPLSPGDPAPGQPLPGYPAGYAASGYPAPGYGAPGYPAPGYGARAYVPRPNSPLAIASLICGIAGLVLAAFVFPLVASIVAVITGHMSLNQIRRDPSIGGKGLGIAGLVLGYIGIAFLLVTVVIIVFSMLFLGTLSFLPLFFI